MSLGLRSNVICGSPHETIPLGHDQHDTPPVLVMTSSFSGNIQARMLPSKTTPDLLGGMWCLLQEAQAVPSRLLWDNETGIGRGKLTDPAAAFAGVLGCEIKLLKARDPESKGMVERMNRFFRQRFMHGRQFASPDDFNAQIADWLPIANARYSRSRRGKPSDLVVIDRAQMWPLSPIAPETMFRNTIRLPRDYYVRVLTNDYSVDPSMIGRLVDVTANLNTVTVSHDGQLVASPRPGLGPAADDHRPGACGAGEGAAGAVPGPHQSLVGPDPGGGRNTGSRQLRQAVRRRHQR